MTLTKSLQKQTSDNARMQNYGAKYYIMALNIEKMCFSENSTLDVSDFKNCDDVSFNIIHAPVNQNPL